MEPDERQQLKTEPLPPDANDRKLPTRIHDLDYHIKYLQEQLVIMQAEIAQQQIERESLLKRAKECSISEDDNYRLVDVPIYDKKRVNVEILKTNYSDKYERILENIKLRIQDKALSDVAKAANFISQADVKVVIREKEILAIVIPEPTVPIRWEVEVVKK